MMDTLYTLFIFTIILKYEVSSEIDYDKKNASLIHNETSSFKPEMTLAQILGHDNEISSRQYGLITFDGQSESNHNEKQPNTYGLIKFEDQNPDLGGQQGNGLVSFEDQQLLPQNNQQIPLKKKRRRRRKPKRQSFPSQYGLQYAGDAPGLPLRPFVYNPTLAQGPQYYRPHRRRKPLSLAEDALATVVKALGSIAQYDDFQCVPRLLCEVAGGKNPSSSGGQTSSILPSFIDLQPLITLLAAYNGISSSPLFLFGRAVFLGVTSKGNADNCRYAYPLCPTDPEKLVDYLNNHNGGFFRFFNGSPQLPPGSTGHQNLQQFYSHLSNIPNAYVNPNQQGAGNQNYGFYNPNIPNPNPDFGSLQNYGLQSNVANYGLYNTGLLNGNDYQDNYNPGYYDQNNKYGFQKNINNTNLSKVYEIDNNRIEKRIQNKPGVIYVDKFEDNNPNWSFPETSDVNLNVDKHRVTKSLKFPEGNTQYLLSYDEQKRKGKCFTFPGTQSNRQYIDYYNYPPLTHLPMNFDGGKLKLDGDGYYVDFDNNNNNNGEDNAEIIYVLRGDGDPNNPEVIKLKPGQTYQ